MSLEALASFAATNNFNRQNKPAQTPVHELTVEEARSRVIVKDGNKIAKEDGSQALTLKLGRYAVALDAVAPKATRINAPADKVEEFSKVLLDAVESGAFDEAIAETIAEAHPDKVEERKAKAATAIPVSDELAEDLAEEEAAPEGVDLDAI